LPDALRDGLWLLVRGSVDALADGMTADPLFTLTPGGWIGINALAMVPVVDRWHATTTARVRGLDAEHLDRWLQAQPERAWALVHALRPHARAQAATLRWRRQARGWPHPVDRLARLMVAWGGEAGWRNQGRLHLKVPVAHLAAAAACPITTARMAVRRWLHAGLVQRGPRGLILTDRFLLDPTCWRDDDHGDPAEGN